MKIQVIQLSDEHRAELEAKRQESRAARERVKAVHLSIQSIIDKIIAASAVNTADVKSRDLSEDYRFIVVRHYTPNETRPKKG